MSATEAIARFVVNASLDAIPQEAIRRAKLALLDCLGVALAGSQFPSSLIYPCGFPLQRPIDCALELAEANNWNAEEIEEIRCGVHYPFDRGTRHDGDPAARWQDGYPAGRIFPRCPGAALDPR